MIQISFQSKSNSSFKIYHENNLISINPLITNFSSKPKIFSLGSCFTWKLKSYLNDYATFIPNWRKCDFDKNIINLDILNDPEYRKFKYLNHLSHFTPPSIYQELYRAINYKNIKQEDYIFPIKGIIPGGKINTEFKWQDVGRRYFISKDKDYLIKTGNFLSKLAYKALHETDIFFISFAAIEQFSIFKNNNEIFYNQHPNQYAIIPDNNNLTRFSLLSYEKVLENLRDIINLIRKIKANNPIMFSISPLYLDRTSTSKDFYISSILAKSTLITAINKAIEEFSNVHYFPAFEIANLIGKDFFEIQSDQGKEKYIKFISRVLSKTIGINSDNIPEIIK